MSVVGEGRFLYVPGPVPCNVKFEIELPDKYAEKLDEVSAVDPTIEDQIEVEVLPEVLRLINDAHRQAQEQERSRLVSEESDETGLDPEQ